ncbi:tyrosine-type recombinase/integrase [Micromonospora sp. NPDC000442]|uniref:tyrosine-type recombinase/integrase n=1 Tax=Micromonospora sp. NPDC000442 TaxID=3364217 RepID=UPI0036C8B955
MLGSSSGSPQAASPSHPVGLRPHYVDWRPTTSDRRPEAGHALPDQRGRPAAQPLEVQPWRLEARVPGHRYPGRPAQRQHVLRHTYASVLLDSGESIKALSMYLGHADPGFTLRTYTHLLPTSEDRTRRAIERRSVRTRPTMTNRKL